MSRSNSPEASERKLLSYIDVTNSDFNFYCSALRINPNSLAGKFVLDIGAGASDFIARVNECGGIGVALDLRYGSESLEDILDAVNAIYPHGIDLDYTHAVENRFRSSFSEGAGHYIGSYTSSLPFRDNSFDLVVSSQLIYKHLTSALPAPQFGQTLREIIRVTKPGGKIKIFPVPTLDHPIPLAMEESVRRMSQLTQVHPDVIRNKPEWLLEQVSPEEDQIVREGIFYQAVLQSQKAGLIETPRFFAVHSVGEDECTIQLVKRAPT